MVVRTVLTQIFYLNPLQYCDTGALKLKYNIRFARQQGSVVHVDFGKDTNERDDETQRRVFHHVTESVLFSHSEPAYFEILAICKIRGQVESWTIGSRRKFRAKNVNTSHLLPGSIF